MYVTDLIKTSGEDLEITFLKHATLYFTFGDLVIHVDSTNMFADYADLPQADLILITHEHFDHFDPEAIASLRKEGTVVVGNEACGEKLEDCVVMRNGDVKTFHGLQVEAVPAYNILHMRSPGNPFHPKGEGNGYVITFADKRVYLAGDTENIPEMNDLREIDIAFLPMNLPYTMSPEMVAQATRAFKPKLLYPYHFGETDTSKIVALLEGEDVEVRIRDMQ
jgi:L-ascorbate metabolism protein UlaG (beta-lactamase superfamily)